MLLLLPASARTSQPFSSSSTIAKETSSSVTVSGCTNTPAELLALGMMRNSALLTGAGMSRSLSTAVTVTWLL